MLISNIFPIVLSQQTLIFISNNYSIILKLCQQKRHSTSDRTSEILWLKLLYQHHRFRIGAFYTAAKTNRNSAQALTVKSEY